MAISNPVHCRACKRTLKSWRDRKMAEQDSSKDCGVDSVRSIRKSIGSVRISSGVGRTSMLPPKEEDMRSW